MQDNRHAFEKSAQCYVSTWRRWMSWTTSHPQTLPSAKYLAAMFYCLENMLHKSGLMARGVQNWIKKNISISFRDLETWRMTPIFSIEWRLTRIYRGSTDLLVVLWHGYKSSSYPTLLVTFTAKSVSLTPFLKSPELVLLPAKMYEKSCLEEGGLQTLTFMCLQCHNLKSHSLTLLWHSPEYV